MTHSVVISASQPPQGRSGADGGRGMPGESGGKVKKVLIIWCHVSQYSGDVISCVTIQW